MVEAREASDSFNSSMPHVGAFSVDGSTDLQIICEGVRAQSCDTPYSSSCAAKQLSCVSCAECSYPVKDPQW